MSKRISDKDFERKSKQTVDLVKEFSCEWYGFGEILENVIRGMSANAGTEYEVEYTEIQIKQMLELARRIYKDETEAT
ncbi:hypothetical protein GCM10008922_12900 [Faecalicatena contorta]|uniref:Uncharacterized protein n=1 Tax=Hungatella hathewayi TaxID=154046 RepID=A0A3E2WWG6_9FIRM|nr:hypothetical protein [Hungatella hathewayi]RGC31513.1 hypothetical protein DWX41_11860 [Hungatella hathewayi]